MKHLIIIFLFVNITTLSFAQCIVGDICEDGDSCSELSIYDENCNCVPEFNFARIGTGTVSPSGSINSRLNDGVIDNALLASTGNGSPHEWVQVELDASRFIENIRIWNRTNCCRERLSNACVLVSNTAFPNNTDLAASLAQSEYTYQLGNTATENVININVAQTGKYIRIQKSGNNTPSANDGDNVINILELEVYGDTLRIDSDLDGLCDFEDSCPLDPNDLDIDNDGVCDYEDLCIGYDDRLDDDLDGIPNGCDNCVNVDNNEAIIVYGMDQNIQSNDAVIDATNNTTGLFESNQNTQPEIIAGAAAHSLTALDFGQTEGYIRTASNATTAQLGNINTTDGITISFWTNYNYDGTTPVSYIAELGNVFNVLAVSTGIIFRFGDAHINAINSVAADHIFNGSWQHMAVTLDYSQSTDNLVMYLNGNPIHTASYATSTSFNSTTDDLIIGARSNGTYAFPGKLDDFGLFDKQICSQDVAELYREGFSKFIDSNQYNYITKSKQGGYTYAWDAFTNDEFTGICPTQEPFDYTGTNFITHAPPVGVHPRIFLSPEDIPDLKNRLENTKSGQSIAALIKAYTIYLNLGGADFDRTAAYALDPQGNPWISNYNAFYICKEEYDRMITQDNTAFTDPAFSVGRRMTLASLLAMEAFDLLINEGETNINISKTYEERCTDLSKAISFWAAYFVNNIEVINDNLGHRQNFSPSLMALVYDLHYHKFSNSQRDIVRQALAKVTPVVPNFGGDGLSCYTTKSNFAPLGAYDILPNLAIEGEAGYKPDLTRQWMRAMYNFMNHGWYKSGSGFEGLGKNYMFMTTLIAGAKRGYSLLPHPHLRAYGKQYLPAIMQPFGHGFTSYDTWGGSGNDVVTGGWKFNHHDAIGLKWVFPDDPTVDFMWRNVISSAKYKNLPSKGYVYQQLSARASSTHDIIPAAIFALDYNEGAFDTKAANTIPIDYFASERGFAVMRSGTDSLSLSSQFHCRQNLGGHTAGDRNDFTLSGLGRMWVRKTIGAGGLGPTYFHSGVLVNDKGVECNVICLRPGKIVDYNSTNELTSVTGDATYAYTWEWSWENGALVGTDGWEEATETPNDFQYIPQNKPYMDTPFFDTPHWRTPNSTMKFVKRLYNPVQRVIRSAAMVRGEHPFLLVVDDVQKDGNIHNYKWAAQIANDLTIESTSIHLDHCNYQNDIILKEPNETGNRRLLVRILNNNDNKVDASDAVLEELEYEGNVSAGNPASHASIYRQRLYIESNSVAPDFRVMLYPHTVGDVLPTTIWNDTKDSLRVIFPDEEKTIALNPQNNGQWNKIELVEEQYAAISCDDGDPCTVNDVIVNCNCAGEYQDSDQDGVCNANDTTTGDCILGAACDDNNSSTIKETYDANCNCIGTNISVQAKVWMEGFYDSTTSQMRTSLKEQGLLPFNQPFNQAPWNYAGTEKAISIPDGVVDWVLVMARDKAGNVINQTAGFLDQTGQLLNIEGGVGVLLEDALYNYISIHTRSHLAVVSATTYQGTPYDFTLASTQVKGIEQLKAVAGTYMLYAGDYDCNGIINNHDFNAWKINGAVIGQYLSIDGDGNGIINNRDYNLWINNRSKVGESVIRY